MMRGVRRAVGVPIRVAVVAAATIAAALVSAGLAYATVEGPSIAAEFSPASIPLNGTSTLTFTLTNPAANTVALSGVNFQVTFPPGSPASSVTTSCGGTTTLTTGGAGMSFSGGSIAVDSSCAVAVVVTGIEAGLFTSQSTLVASDGTFGNATFATLTVVAPPSIAAAFSPASIPPTGTSTLTFTLTNPSANFAPESGVAFSDALPAGLVVATPNGLSDSCGGTVTATAGGASISLTGGSIAVDSSCTVVVDVTGTGGGTFINTSSMVSSTNGGTGNTATATLTITDGDLAIAKHANVSVDATGPSGATVSYTPPAVTDPDDASPPAAVCIPKPGSVFKIGTTTVTCTAADADDTDSPVSTTFTVTVRGAAAQLADLYQAVLGVRGGTGLAPAVAQAERQVAGGHPLLACQTLTLFIIEVQLETRWRIPAGTAADLVAAARQIQAVLGCSSHPFFPFGL